MLPRADHPIHTNVRPPLVPVLPARGLIEPDLDRIVSALVRARDSSDAALRDALFDAYAARLHHILIRLWYRSLSGFGCELDDLEQELYLIFIELLDNWSGSGSFSAYVHGAVPWRLYDAARRLAPRDRPLGDRPVAAANVDLSQSDAGMVLLLEELALRLSPFERELLLLHVRDGIPLSRIAAQRGASARTMRRAWLRLQQHLRQELASETRDTIGQTRQ
ncbi:MAG: sigma-70 family RNA polymerase sigma factor [Thermomicrobiales bacterium]